jgi:hypothetical protein
LGRAGLSPTRLCVSCRGPDEPKIKARLKPAFARPILFRVGPCFGLLFSGRARAGPKSPAHIPSTSYGCVAWGGIYPTQRLREGSEFVRILTVSRDPRRVLLRSSSSFASRGEGELHGGHTLAVMGFWELGPAVVWVPCVSTRVRQRTQQKFIP